MDSLPAFDNWLLLWPQLFFGLESQTYIPEMDSTFFKNAELIIPEPKKSISLRIDSDVLKWFKKKGTGYQTKMNAVLRMFMEAQT